jgi:photosystem II stability/assembly factor-like uncharacterized protein
MHDHAGGYVMPETSVNAAASRVSLRRWIAIRWPWAALSAALVLAGALLTLFPMLRGEPLRAPPAADTFEYWFAPPEQNNFRRVTTESAALYAAVLTPDQKTFLAAGTDGEIVRGDGTSWRRTVTGERTLIASIATLSDSKTAFAVGRVGLMLRTTDSGETWSRVPLPESVTAALDGKDLNAIAFAANGKIGVTVGEGGIILRTTDGGVSWTPLKEAVAGSGKDFLTAVAVSADGTVALAAGDSGNIMRSTDGGASWKKVASQAGTKTLFSIAMTGNGAIAIAAGADHTLLRSEDGGQTWTSTAPAAASFAYANTAGMLRSVVLPASGACAVAVGPDGLVLRSLDTGKTWERMWPSAGAWLNGAAVSADCKRAVAVGYDGTILHSTDSGVTWDVASWGWRSPVSFVSLALTEGEALAMATEGTILRSLDDGVTWSIAPWSQDKGLEYALLDLPARHATFVAGAGGFFVGSTNGRRDWSDARLDTSQALTGLAASEDGATLIAVGWEGTIRQSSTLGLTWVNRDSPVKKNLLSVALAPNGRTALAVGEAGTIVRSDNEGVTWASLESGTAETLESVTFVGDGSTAVAVGLKGAILRGSDWGRTWKRTADLTGEDLLCVSFVPGGHTGFAIGAFGTILRTTDGGQSWDLRPNTIKTFLRSVRVHADGRRAIAVGANGTIVRTTDGGQTWTDAAYHQGQPKAAWLALLLGLSTLFPLFVPPPPPLPPAIGLAELLASDRPLRAGDRDISGASDLAAQIGKFLRNAQTTPPIAIAITGPWGSGKSSVLARLYDDLKQNAQRPVRFNAWHRQGEESLFAALIQAVRTEAVPSPWTLAGLAVRLGLFSMRVAAHPVLAPCVIALLAAVAGFLLAAPFPSVAVTLRTLRALVDEGKFGEAGPKLLLGISPVFAIGIGLLILTAGLRDKLSSAGLDPGRLLAAAGRAARWKDLGAQLAFRDRFKEALTEVTSALGRRILTILIDDLDRCRPDQIAEVLEAINFLSDGNGCYIVFGYARDRVLAGVGLANREISAELQDGADAPEIRRAYAEQYLRKLVQIEVAVPRFDPEMATRFIAAAPAGSTAESGSERLWRPWLAMVTILLVAVIGVIAGERFYPRVQTAWEQAEKDARLPPRPLDAQGIAAARDLSKGFAEKAPPPSSQSDPVVASVSRPELIWQMPLAALALYAAGLAAAAVLQKRRPPILRDDDTAEFSTALRHWASAAFELHQSPREMKRFLNRLRFAAAGKTEGLPDHLVVGLGVLAHADVGLVEAIAGGDADWRATLAAKSATMPGFAAILAAIDRDRLDAAGLPAFAPGRSQAARFARLWDGVSG